MRKINIYSKEVFKRNIVVICSIITSIISISSVIIITAVVSKSNQPNIMAIDSNGTRLVSSASDPIYKTEALVFIQRFLFNTYNFNHENFIKRIGLITSMMSEELWLYKKQDILKLKSNVETNEIQLQGELLKITQDDSGNYHGLIEVTEKTRLHIKKHQIKTSLKLKSVPRSTNNPAGLEVDSYEESIIHN